MRVEVEICVADIGGVAAARLGGADRVELCSAIELGGLTPSMGATELAMEQAGAMAVTLLIRPRGGDFVYDEDEVATMERDIAAIVEACGGDPRLGFTIGALTPEGQPDWACMDRLVARAGDAPVLMHKAFDVLPDPLQAACELAEHGILGTLTAGGPEPAHANLDALGRLVAEAPICIAAAGGVRAATAPSFAEAGLRRLHLLAASPKPSSSRVGSMYDSPQMVTDATLVAEVVDALQRG